MWYDKLGQISDVGGILKDLNVAASAGKDESCVAITTALNSPQIFSVIAVDCNKKQLAICRIKPPLAPAPKKELNFRCLEESNGRWLYFYCC